MNQLASLLHQRLGHRQRKAHHKAFHLADFLNLQVVDMHHLYFTLLITYQRMAYRAMKLASANHFLQQDSAQVLLETEH